jgi:hypothetical protein
MAIYRGPGGAGDAVADTTNQSEAAQVAAAAAQASANEAAGSASTASSSSTAAASSASAASTSASNASSSASAASTSASNASTSATNAANSATAADTSATNAANSATAAANSATTAGTSATNAANSATAADTSASNASTSATNAANSATSASNSAIAAAASYDSFDDRYLGAKSSAPSTDNDGDALLTGALYYNTAVNQLYIWDGTQWDDAAFSVSGSVTSFNTRTGAVTLSSADVTTALGFTPVQTETDPVVGAITGIVKANGAGTISAAVSGTDYLAPAAIGVTVQGYDADTAKYDDATANFTGTLQNGGHTVLTNASDYLDSTDIGVSVQGYDVDTAKLDVAQSFTAQQTFKELKDTVHTISDGAAFEIDPANGSMQVVTLGASRTPAATNFEAGQIILIGVDDGTDYTIDWTTINPTWVKAGGTGAAPTLATTGYTWILLWKVSTTIYATEVGQP